MVSDQEIAKAVESFLRQTDLQSSVSSINDVVQQLGEKLGLDLTHKAEFIRDQINLILRSHPPAPHHHHHHAQPPPPAPAPTPTPAHGKDHFALHSHPQQYSPGIHPQQFPPHFALHPYHHPQQHPHSASPPPQQPFLAQVHVQTPPQPQPHPAQPSPATASVKPEAFSPKAEPKESAPTPVGTKRRGGPGGLNKVCGVSPQLQVVVGEPALPRTEIVKQLWAYIRKNNLQDPSNKRKIICDDALRVVFETDCTDMFKMNKLLAKHIIALEPSKASTQSKRAKVEAVEPAPETTDANQASVLISEALAKFLGAGGREMIQAEAIRRVWEYIKANQLEDPLNSMVILCDAKLTELLGCETISALGISEVVSRKHLFQRT